MALFGKKPSAAAPVWPSGSTGKRLYAIGDVHGCLAQLDELLAIIEADHRRRPLRDCHIVFLGDLIDRGPDSAGVLRRLRLMPPEFATLHFLKGNHEEMFVRCLTGSAELIPRWLEHGGKACAISYGIDPSRLLDQDPEFLEHLLLSYIPQEDIRFVSGFLDTVRFGDYLLVHAGIRPGIPVALQSGHDLRWIRGDFLNSDARHEAMIVHGHTVTEGVVRRANRIGLDTGAYKTGILSAMRIEEAETSILMAAGAAPD